MSVSGRIAIDVEFLDRTATAAGSSLNTIALRNASEYTTGKVAVVAGTCGTSAVTVATALAAYRDAAGAAVTFASLERVAFSSPTLAYFDCEQRGLGSDNIIASRNGEVTVVDTPSVTFVYTTAGTASYTLVLYGT
jgi:hypothetical protein